MKDNSRLILVVDDNPSNLQVLGKLLRENGYRPAAARGGRQAIEFVRKRGPDLILLDMMMPGLDGLETCAELKKSPDTASIPVIFITALTDADTKVKAFEAGGVDYITKPFMREEVLARIDVHLRLRNAMQRLEQMSLTDELTGAFNRRHAYLSIDRQIAVAERRKEPFCLCFVDVDNFKSVNDNVGHWRGDKLLVDIVRVIKNSIRESDFVFRTGGDEFLILLPNTGVNDAENLVQRVTSELVRECEDGLGIGFSRGIAQYAPESGVTGNDLIRLADERMYEDKRSSKMSGKSR